MTTHRIMDALAGRFAKPLPTHLARRILFWYDSAEDFNALEIATMMPAGVKLLILDGNAFKVKKTLERDDPGSNYVVYCAAEPPPDKENWLLDIQLYSEPFSADRASLVMDDLGVQDFLLKEAFDKHGKFFASKERLQAFRALGLTLKTTQDVERGILAVLAKAGTVDGEEIVRAVLAGSLDDDENGLWTEMRKAGVANAFWAMAKELCHYANPKPDLRTLFLSLLLTATAEELQLDQKTAWAAYLLPGAARSRAVVFIDHWMKHQDLGAAYEEHARRAWKELELKQAAEGWPVEVVARGRTFEGFDKLVLAEIVHGLEAGLDAFDRWEEWIGQRRRSRWWAKYQTCYEALGAAIGLMRLRREFEGRFKETTAKEMAEAYVSDYHRVDRLYREFVVAQGRVDSDLLHKVAAKVEELYTQWFLPALLDRWNVLVETGLAGSWRIPGVTAQRDFFECHAKPTAGERNKVFVLISDGLRYDVAARLAEALEEATRSTPKLDWMLGSVPSYTELGMASLLPHTAIAWDDKGHVTVDGQPAASGNRENLLKKAFAESKVVRYEDLMVWSREEAREALGGARIVYIYHNRIDYLGDKVASENQTFEAADAAVEELLRAILKICNSLNGTYVLVTADHGFLYQRTDPPESDRVTVDKLEAVAGGRRFLLAEKGRKVEGAIEIGMDWLLGPGCGLAAYVPRGNMRFKAPGGARYVHGGASLQEVIIPLLAHTHVRKSQVRADEARKVDVELTNTDRRITSTQFVCNCYQVEPVGGKVLPRRLRVALWTTGADGKMVSTEELLVADNPSGRPDERTPSLRLHLNPGIPNGDYTLRMVDDETQIEYRSIPFRVSLAITRIQFWNE